MSPFWKNVDEELKFLNMNLKTLAKISGVPYPTITNGRNRENSIPEMETAKKIANALHKPLEVLIGMNSNSIEDIKNQSTEDENFLYKKYEDIIKIFEEFPVPLRESLKNTLLKFYATYKMINK